jgi:hypothetical protein
MRALALILALIAAPALAERALPSDRVEPDDRRRFSLCRAATLYHLQDELPPEARVPRAVAEAMIEQMSFIMFETIKNAPSGSLAESRRSLAFVEQFFLDFGRLINTEREMLADVQAREALLMECVVLIWQIVSDDIDYLIRWREQAIDAPADLTPTP